MTALPANRLKPALKAICLLLVLLALSPGCSGDTPVLVTLTGDESGAQGFLVTPTFQGQPGTGRVLDVTQRQVGFWIPSGQSGPLHVEVAVDSGSAEAGCTRTPATADLMVQAEYAQPIDVTVDLGQVGPLQCSPISFSKITPALGPTAGGSTLEIDGQNFTQGTTVTVAGIDASLVKMESNRLTAVLPAALGAFGLVPVVVSTPDGRSASRSDLFKYYASQLEFPVQPYSAGYGQSSVAVGDLNGDGHLDLAVVETEPYAGSVLLGDGKGGFSVPFNFQSGSQPVSVAVGDFNGDSHLDLAVANYDSGHVSILLGDGKGGVSAPTNFQTGSAPHSVAAGDFNGDNHLDLAVANYDSGNVSVLLGDGMGGFAAPANFQAGSTPTSVAVGDFNGDSHLDLAVTNYLSSNVNVLFGDGMGGFAAPANFQAGSWPISVVAGDFNEDSHLDLAVANFMSGNVSLLLGDGNASFFAPANFQVGLRPYSVALGDFNGDSHLDLAVANDTDGYGDGDVSVSMLLGDGKGGFAGPFNFQAGNGPESVAVGDFDENKKPDLAVGNVGGDIAVMLNQSK